MRPIRLELEGFTAFREKCAIDFSTFDLFAITGQTGAGKTSLLDAMTYSLYGKTSRLNKSGRELVSQGAASMSVLLHFRVGTYEYRVSRVMKGASPIARLEKLQDGEWKGVSGGIVEINEQVAQIIGLDFEGFTKAVILPQGKFDVFLRGKPDERRDVLNELLDMGVYQRMMQSANEKSRLASERAKVKETEIDPVATPETRAERERELAESVDLERALADIVGRLERAWLDSFSLREKRIALQKAQTELVDTQKRIASAEIFGKDAELAAERERISIESLDYSIAAVAYDSELHLKLAEWEQPAIQRENLRAQAAEHARKREAECADLATAEGKEMAARELLAKVAGDLKDAELLRGSRKALSEELERRYGSTDAIGQVIEGIDAARANCSEIPKLQQQIGELGSRTNLLVGAVAAAQDALTAAEAEVETAVQKYERVHARDRAAALRHELKPGEPCPVCEQTIHLVPRSPDAKELSTAERQVKVAKGELKKAQDMLLGSRAEAEGLPGKLNLANKQIAMYQSTLDAATGRASKILGRPVDESATGELQLLIEQLRTAKVASQKAESHHEKILANERNASHILQDAEHARQSIRNHIDTIDAMIASSRDALEGLEQVLEGAPPLEELRAKLNALKAAKRKREEIEETRKKSEKALRQAEDLVAGCRKDAEALENRRLKCADWIEELSKDIAKLEKQVRRELGDLELAAPPGEAAQIERVRERKRKDLEEAQAGVQQCRFAIQTLTERIANNERLRAEVVQHKAEEAVYRDLGTWLNAGNFQQYLLGSAFELLATEGSKHLKALSDDRYTFAYRDKEFEVIDKWNGDEPRSVNTLSGGESFLASLALALALAESIAELNSSGGVRALESLFLDEGFSTLDAETLGNVADAIQLLQNGKRLIGIVTHVQSLADQMPTRIEVEKTVSGSRIRQAGASG